MNEKNMPDTRYGRPGRQSRAAPIPLSFAIALTVVSGPASAEKVSAALARAFVDYPDLPERRAALRGTDEGVAIGRGGYRPTLSADGSGSWTDVGDDELSRVAIAAQLEQPLFDGFRTRNAVVAGDAVLEAIGSRDPETLDLPAGGYAQTACLEAIGGQLYATRSR